MKQIVKKISAFETYVVRQGVLRPGKPIENCRFEGDELETTKHFGIFDNDELAGIVTVLENTSDLFDETMQFQVRGMAVLDTHQKKGFGEKLLLAAEDYILNQSGKLVWFNAREIAIRFYEKNGYKKAGNLFGIPGVGPHYVMYKYL